MRRPTNTILILASALISASCAPMDRADKSATISDKNARELAKRFDGQIAGEAKKCVSTSRLGQPVVYGNKILVYSGSGGTQYRNDLPANCPGLDDDDIILTKMTGTQLCKGDPIEPVDRFTGFSGPVCRLGLFIPYSKPKG